MSFLEVISIKACGTISVFGVSFALIRDGGADVVSVEGPSVGAFQADLVVPIPGSASLISGLGIVGEGEEALSVLEVISFVADGAVAGSVVLLALVGNGNADFVGVEGPSLGAGKADLVVPVPGGASEIAGGCGVCR